MKFLPLGLLILMIFCIAGYGQADNPPVCPALWVEGPGQMPKPNELVIFKAKFGGDAPSYRVTYQWSVSSSDILEGQNTDQIKVRFPGNGRGLTATVDVKGLPHNCISVASETSDGLPPPQSVLLVKYGPISTTKENVELGEAAEALNDDPSATMTILIYRTKKQPVREAETRKASMVSRLVESFGVDVTRVTFVFGEADAPRTEIYLVPAGAGQPKLISLNENPVIHQGSI